MKQQIFSLIIEHDLEEQKIIEIIKETIKFMHKAGIYNIEIGPHTPE